MPDNLLLNIDSPMICADEAQLPQLAQELRNFIIDVVSVKEGHLVLALGVMELTIASLCLTHPMIY
jgi:1-deoxy-D-xylulose-5-phosphate synthase